jgi:transposase
LPLTAAVFVIRVIWAGAEWAVVEPMVPPAKPGGRKRTIDVREILNGIFYVLWTGC